MKLSTTTGDFSKYEQTPEQSVRLIRKAGFRFIDYSFGYDFRNRTGFYSDDWQAHGDMMLALADELGITFVQAHSPMGAPITPNERQRPFIEETKHSIKAAAYLGIPNIVVHAGHCNGVLKEQNFRDNKVFFDEILTVAEKVGINILVENFNSMFSSEWYWIDNVTETLELCSLVNHPRLKICWDTGHGNLPEHTGKNLSQRDALNLLGDKVRGIHVQDNFGNGDHHLLPGFGSLDIDSLMLGLKDIGFNGYFNFETNGIPSAKLPIEFREELEAMLYRIGASILRKYDCFEE